MTTRAIKARERFMRTRLQISWERYLTDVGIEHATTRGFHQWCLTHPEA